MTRLIQIKKDDVRRVALVDEPNVRLLKDCHSIYELAQVAFDSGKGLGELAQSKIQHENDSIEYDIHRRPGDVHVHFFGTDCLSFGDQIRLKDGDALQIFAEGYGRPLRNPARVDRSKDAFIRVISIR